MIEAAVRADEALNHLKSCVQHADRSHRVYLFVHAAFNSVVSSTGLLVEGYPLASGHLMRHFGEATAMAMFCADPQSRVLEEFDQRPSEYRVDKSVDRVRRSGVSKRLRSLLGLDQDRWREFADITEFYDDFSHATAFSLAFHVTLSQPELLIVGAHFDDAKQAEIVTELKRRRSALDTLYSLIQELGNVLPRRMAQSAP